MLLNAHMQRAQIVMKMAASNPTRSTIITRIRKEASSQRRNVSILKGTTTHLVRTPRTTMTVNQRRYSYGNKLE